MYWVRVYLSIGKFTFWAQRDSGSYLFPYYFTSLNCLAIFSSRLSRLIQFFVVFVLFLVLYFPCHRPKLCWLVVWIDRGQPSISITTTAGVFSCLLSYFVVVCVIIWYCIFRFVLLIFHLWHTFVVSYCCLSWLLSNSICFFFLEMH